jgi:predicted regulator of Ras-like GTPase activity (Roadblock/LC7/MglB family)
VENQLLELLEYRGVLGVLTTSLDGLLVATVAIGTEDAELIAASAANHADQGDTTNYWTTSSEHGALHAARGREMRLIVLSEPGIDRDSIRELMTGQLQSIEDAISV